MACSSCAEMNLRLKGPSRVASWFGFYFLSGWCMCAGVWVILPVRILLTVHSCCGSMRHHAHSLMIAPWIRLETDMAVMQGFKCHKIKAAQQTTLQAEVALNTRARLRHAWRWLVGLVDRPSPVAAIFHGPYSRRSTHQPPPQPHC